MRLVPVRWKRTLCAAQRTRNSSLRVDSSPMRSDSWRSYGLRAGLGAQVGDELGRDALPVGVEVDGGRVEEREAGAVRRLLAAVEHRRVQRAAERVGADVVEPGVAHERRRGDLVEDLLHDRPDALLDRSRRASRATGLAARARSKRCARSASSSWSAPASPSRTQLGDAADVAALQALVVLDAHRRPARRPPRGAGPARAACRSSGRPACSGVILARRVVRNSAMSLAASTVRQR